MLRKIALKLYEVKYAVLAFYGISWGLIQPYEQSLIKKLRTVYCGGLPASVLLLIDKMCNGFCYDRATLITLGMEKFELVWGSDRCLALRYGLDRADHCWAESDGWVYDTSDGYRTKKWLYYLMNSPKVRRRKDQDWCIEQELYQDLLRSKNENDKYMLPIVIPMLEQSAQESRCSGWAKAELDLFKETVGYDQLVEEIRQDVLDKGFSVMSL